MNRLSKSINENMKQKIINDNNISKSPKLEDVSRYKSQYNANDQEDDDGIFYLPKIRT